MPTPTSWTEATDSTLTGQGPVDSLIGGFQWESHSLTYSFPGFFSSWSSDPVTGYPLSSDQEPRSSGYFVLSSSDIAAVKTALGAWSAVSGLRFNLVSESSSLVGDLRFAYSDTQADAQAWAYLPSSTAFGGDVWFNSGGTSFDFIWTQGSYEYMTAVHEIGHALGLKHPFEVMEMGGSVINATVLDPALDSRSYTIMSYAAAPANQETGFSYEPTTPMVLDIAAIQSLYGANGSTNVGNTAYVFLGSKTYHQTLWDAGGIDTLTYSASVGGLIDLRQGTDFGSQLGQRVFIYDSLGTDLGEVHNLWIAYGTVIENAVGGSGNDVINGNEVTNTLDGRAGADTMAGGAGDDTYIVDHAGDGVVENADEGNDLVRVALAIAGGSFTLAAHTENATLLNTVGFTLQGNALDNTLTGNAAANTLIGLAGDDTLDGKGGADVLIGGEDDDTYVIDHGGDLVVEEADAGSDLVRVALSNAGGSYTLAAHVEHATLINAVAYKLVGNDLANTLIGNALANTLDGGAGADVLNGGLGNDTYTIGAGDNLIDTGGIDSVVSSVDHSLGADFEHLTLSGSADLDGTGNALANTILGNTGANTLDGAGGVDLLKGGAGNDTYRVDLTATNLLQDALSENTLEGNDSVVLRGGNTGLAPYATLTLGAHLEGLDASGTTTAKLHLTGNALANTLTGNDAANTLDGKAGADQLIGGLGDDTYVLDNLGDEVTENAAEGSDLVKVAIATANGTHTLTDNVENGTLINTVAYNLVGNTLANTLTGNAAANTLDGGAGADSLIGGLGNDTYLIDDIGDSITDSGGSDTVRSSLTYSLGSTLENLVLTGSANLDGSGNALANTLTGNDGANTLTGGLGNDTYLLGAGDLAIESSTLASEIDTVQSSVSTSLGANLEHLTLTGNSNIDGTGNNLANTLTGNSGDNTLDGGLSDGKVDALKGGDGDDTYQVDLTSSNLIQDSITENLNQGNDSVVLRGGNTALLTYATLTLGAHLEGLDASGTTTTKLHLTGNALANTLTGNDAANTLDGGLGADALIGGLGDDTYVLDNLGDDVSENAGQGSDTLRILIATAGAGITLAANVDNALLLNSVAFNLSGNALANTLTGNAAANTLDGGGGADALIGGLGNDTYVIDDLGDTIGDSGGNDTVRTPSTPPSPPPWKTSSSPWPGSAAKATASPIPSPAWPAIPPWPEAWATTPIPSVPATASSTRGASTASSPASTTAWGPTSSTSP
ncbi:MAG: matrixin family metalloprotease [Betaproteobacteria bacterium]|nr:matrixin family metalloprotease [Betaproteobacteria bacterium]